MQGYHLKVGQYLSYQDKVYTITEERADDTFELRRLSDNFHIYLTKDDLLEGLIEATVKFIDKESIKNNKVDVKTRITADFLTFPEEQKTIARRKLAYVKAVIDANLPTVKQQTFDEVIEKVAAELKDERKPHWNTVYRWHREYLSSGKDVRQLTTNDKKKGNRQPRLQVEVQRIITKVINDHYLSEERPSMHSTYIKVCTKIQEENEYREEGNELIAPSYLTVRANIQKLPPEVVTEKHYGDQRAKVEFRAYKSGLDVTRILERVEADHTPLQLFVVDDIDRLPLGRPTLTTIIDYYSRAVLGFYISFYDPSTQSFLEALRYAIFPKNNVKKIYPEIEHDWECYGIPELLIVDNGKEFHSEAFFDTCNGLGIPYQHAPPLHPWYKGVVERHFGTINKKLLNNIPGKTFESIAAKADYDPVKNAVISFSALIEVVHVFIIDIYNQSHQKALGMSPAQKWRENAEQFPPRIPQDLERVNVDLGMMKERTILKDGIQYKTIKYNNDALGALRRKLPHSTKVKFKVNPNNIDYINVLDPTTDSYFTVYSSDLRRTKNKTLYQFKIIRRYALQKYKNDSTQSILRAERRINGIMDAEMRKNKKISSRKRIGKFKNTAQDIDSLIGIKQPSLDDAHLPGDDLIPDLESDESTSQPAKIPEPTLEDFYADDSDWQTSTNTGSVENEKEDEN